MALWEGNLAVVERGMPMSFLDVPLVLSYNPSTSSRPPPLRCTTYQQEAFVGVDDADENCNFLRLTVFVLAHYQHVVHVGMGLQERRKGGAEEQSKHRKFSIP